MTMKFQFYLRYSTQYGESLWIGGNTESLGMNDADRLMPLQHLNNDFWTLIIDISPSDLLGQQLQYKYFFRTKEGEFVSEFNAFRTVDWPQAELESIKVYDVWNYAGEFENVFYTAPFTKFLLPAAPDVSEYTFENISHLFEIKAPLLKENEVVCLMGSDISSTPWNITGPILLKKENDSWKVGLNLHGCNFPIAYKYGVYNIHEKKLVCFEDGFNRICFKASSLKEQLLMRDGFIHLPNNTWRGAGLAIPVFSLRSKNGLGIGEFNDLPLLVDWAVTTGLSMIQILPVNDTTATHTWKDSYPYAAISAFALHPIFLNIETVAGGKHSKLIADIQSKKKELNALQDVDYEQVLQLKMDTLRFLFNKDGEACLRSKGYKNFFIQNEDWLKPYAAFCYLRDTFHTSDYNQWEKYALYSEEIVNGFFDPKAPQCAEVGFYCYLQYHLHIQLKAAVEYAHKKRVVLKGDIPIGVYRYGCDTWVSPELYKMHFQAGAPPDDFAAVGQNWGFPTYNWRRMQADHFAWWHKRFRQMNDYFDAFRIDHILGFFRIWSIPIHAVQGIMGKFDPCIPVYMHEFGNYGIHVDYDRFCKPYITDAVLQQIFGDKADMVKTTFLQHTGNESYALLPEFDTQIKIRDFFNDHASVVLNTQTLSGLYDLVSNVILFAEDSSHGNEFHFRIAMEKTTSFQSLPQHEKDGLWALYIDYFFRRQDDFWKKESLNKLPSLKAATNMLVCGEDLGMVPSCVPEVMKHLGILSLEIQRMPKQSHKEFFNPAEAPYLSVVTPSTHDMSTVRGWWQENRQVTQRFYNTMLGHYGEAPFYCEPWISRSILLQHLHSPAMWSVFQLQDILGISGKLRREKPEEERINVPANPCHYWRYRMHLYLEDLLLETDFNEELHSYIKGSGR